MNYGKPPFRADHVGSLPRPPELLRARELHQKGTLSAQSLREIEDRSIRDIAKLQEEIGLQAITDGEYRRTIWHADFLRQIEGVRVQEGATDNDSVARKFRSGDQEIARSPDLAKIYGGNAQRLLHIDPLVTRKPPSRAVI